MRHSNSRVASFLCRIGTHFSEYEWLDDLCRRFPGVTMRGDVGCYIYDTNDNRGITLCQAKRGFGFTNALCAFSCLTHTPGSTCVIITSSAYARNPSLGLRCLTVQGNPNAIQVDGVSQRLPNAFGWVFGTPNFLPDDAAVSKFMAYPPFR